MNMLSFLPSTKAALAAAAILAGVGIAGHADQSFAGGPVKITGYFENTYAKKEVAPVARADDGHVLMLSMAGGKNTDAGGNGYMDGGSVSIQEIDDLVQGNGPQQGYGTFTSGADSAHVKFEGRLSTTLNPDKTPNTTFKGKWTFVSGTGKYSGVTGNGTYAGKMVSENSYRVDWTGFYELGKTAAAN